jgi:hypothetical protein
MSTDNSKIVYEPEADVLSLEISRGVKIDSAKEIGNVVVHFTPYNVPVLIEILNTSQSITQAQNVLNQNRGTATAGSAPAGA